ncbi:MAG: BON domain-containing protein [Labilithrix sp.]|nr:BON domain-containing protein [Labilithrix sp.]
MRTIATVILVGLFACSDVDRRLEHDVEQILAAQPINTEHVEVSVRHGVVKLEGRVTTPEERDRLIANARAVDGVRWVEDRLVIGPLRPRDIQMQP